MTITAQEDIIDGAEVRVINGVGSATRVFNVITTAGESMDDIYNSGAIPQYGDPYPGGVYIALDISIRPLSDQNTLFQAVVHYGVPDFAQKPPSTSENDAVIQVGSTVTSVRTQRDVNGDPIIITLTGQPDQLAEVEEQIPQTVIVFERREATSPGSKSTDFTGKLNNASLGPGSAYAAGTLLCLGIEGTSTDSGDTWQVTYRFQYNPNGWDAEAVYIDPETGLPHEDVDLEASPANNGWISVAVYESVSFAGLNLPFGSL